jgi:hypothetical protein
MYRLQILRHQFDASECSHLGHSRTFPRGAKTLHAAVLPSLPLKVSGSQLVLKPAGILLEPTVENGKFNEGNPGIDLLPQAHKTTFDFRAMTLTLE